jgi:hypothetical protein
VRALAIVGSVIALLAAPAAAQDAGKRYAGVGLALTNFDGAHEGIAYGDSSAGLHLYGGYQARELMAVELAVERFSGLDSGNVLGSGVERLRIAADLQTVTVRGVFSVSLEEVLRRRRKISLFGTFGVGHVAEKRRVTALTTSRQTATTERDNGLAVGVGAVFDLPRIRLRAHLQSQDRAGPSLTTAGVAAELRF